jgi:hypothetical protein
VVLLVAGGAFMLLRALDVHRSARSAEGPGGLLGARLALVWGLVGTLALVTAAVTAWTLVRRPRPRTLRLEDVPPPGGVARRASPPASRPP